ncbi:hypothetical protein PR202_ga10077 [Eleusine coracana subsp. coracana]|uniref:Uncharacterized protein n=1 Tax=Eleusine coracana subsp. coracana TaxID=191504 RepID=A0AAV5C5S9_ELECO|nr:hypothetical protein PR202_ga10077 [Eleusine coracana subsp. coracana]
MALVLCHPLPPLLLIAFLAATSNGAPSVSGGVNYISYRTMEQPGPCGNVTIKYPFYWYKSGFPLVNNSSYCGYPGLGIQCEDGEDGQSAVLQLGNQKYNVLNISYTDLTVSVVDHLVSVKDESCPSISHNVTLLLNSWLSYPNDTVDYLHFFLNCFYMVDAFESLLKSVLASVLLALPLILSNCHVAFLRCDGAATGTEAYEHECEEVVVAPVLGVHKVGMMDAPDGIPPSTNGTFGPAGVVEAGFELMYHAHSEQCDGCESSGGWCGYQRNGSADGVLTFTCFCDGGPTSGRCGAQFIELELRDRRRLQVIFSGIGLQIIQVDKREDQKFRDMLFLFRE